MWQEPCPTFMVVMTTSSFVLFTQTKHTIIGNATHNRYRFFVDSAQAVIQATMEHDCVQDRLALVKNAKGSLPNIDAVDKTA